jgi:hypothetical protein
LSIAITTSGGPSYSPTTNIIPTGMSPGIITPNTGTSSQFICTDLSASPLKLTLDKQKKEHGRLIARTPIATLIGSLQGVLAGS